MPVASRRASSASSAELGRQRNLNRYYQPWLNTKNKLNAVPAASDVSLNTDSAGQPVCSHDTTLTALAQLAALRLNVKRAMVSLIDTTTQIILAEATQTLSLVDESRHMPGDNIWLGNVTLPRADCMDEHAFTAITVCKDPEGNPVQMSAEVVEDTFLDDRFKDRVYVTAPDGVRFYAGVPIITKEGHSIGVYGVSDTKPRPGGLTFDEIQFMQDVAEIVADHLHRVLDSVGRVSERDFMKGISYFLEDQSEFKYKLSNADASANKSGAVDGNSHVQATDPQPSPPPSRGRSSHQVVSSPGTPKSSSPVRAENVQKSKTAAKVPRFTRDIGPQDKEKPKVSDDNTRRIFAQASQVFCDQGKAAGCVFVEASSNMFSTSPEQGSCPPTSIDTSQSQEDLDFDTTDDLSGPAGASKAANILSATLVTEDLETFSQGIISRPHLKKCILRYPFGKSFYLNKGRIVADQMDTGTTSKEDKGDVNPSALIPSRKLLPPEVLERIPDAKWLIFLPLFNYARSQWCAAGFIWGNDFKMGDPDEALPFVKAFGCCMMSEFESMEVLNMNIAKSTFIASVSHDLRSPLHGMLGSLEFLEDSVTSAYQMSLISSMETCGKTLLDTIDHLLDFAKINNLNRSSTSRSQRHRNQPESQGLMALTSQEVSGPTCFDFSLLLEEVVEAVFVGQTFRKITLRNRDSVDEASAEIKAMTLDDSTSTDDLIHEGSAKFSGRVCLVLNVEKSPSWCVQGRAGALRRVIMNVVGNAIKYCKTGYIEVSASIEEADQTDTKICFSVKDTGIGMSEEFMANRLFKAFSQEDSFTPGTGLGLSITAQIVENLGGRIRIDSEKGVGTHVHISLPMKTAPPNSYMAQEDLVFELEKISAGKKLCVLNPLHTRSDILGKSGSKLESSIISFCQDWFHMVCVRDDDVGKQPDTQIYVYAEPPPIEELVRMHHEQEAKGQSVKDAALLIICTNAFEAAALRAAGVDHLTSLGRVIEVTSQPVGLRKLAKIILQCLIRIEKAEVEANLASDTLTSELEVDNEVRKRAAEVKLNTLPLLNDPRAMRDRPSFEKLRWKSDEPRRKTTFIDPSTEGSLRTLSKFEGRSEHEKHPASESIAEIPHLPHVLLVDDNAINLKLLVTFVKKIKLPYAEATNGLEAYTKYKDTKTPFDYVLMDLQMPIMDGFEATRKIRELESERGITKPVTIIAITGVGNDNARKDALDAGMSRYLTKPVKFRELQHLLITP